MDAPRSRTPLVADLDAGFLRTGPHQAPITPGGDALESYLSLVYAARGIERGTRLPLRDEDLDVLAALVGDDPDDVESRLIELMDCSPEEARSLRAVLLGRRTVATAAGVALVFATLAGLTGGGGPSAPAGALAAAPMEVVAPAPAPAPAPLPAPAVAAPPAPAAVEVAPEVRLVPTSEVLGTPRRVAPAELARRSEAPTVVRLVPVDEVLAEPPTEVSSDVVEREVELPPPPPQPAPIPLPELPVELVLPDLPAPGPLPIVGDGPAVVDDVLPDGLDGLGPDAGTVEDPTGELPLDDVVVPIDEGSAAG